MIRLKTIAKLIFMVLLCLLIACSTYLGYQIGVRDEQYRALNAGVMRIDPDLQRLTLRYINVADMHQTIELLVLAAAEAEAAADEPDAPETTPDYGPFEAVNKALGSPFSYEVTTKVYAEAGPAIPAPQPPEAQTDRWSVPTEQGP